MVSRNKKLINEIIETIKSTDEELCVIDIAERINVERHTVLYNIQKLVEMDILETKKRRNLTIAMLRGLKRCP